MLYPTVKLLHVLLAITAVGANLTYGVWYDRANRYPEFAAVALRSIRLIDNRIANPAYGGLLLTGLLMAWMSGLLEHTLWVHLALGLYVLLVLAAVIGFSPALKAQIAAVERAGVNDPAFAGLSRRANIWAAILMTIVIAILVVMVFKPV